MHVPTRGSTCGKPVPTEHSLDSKGSDSDAGGRGLGEDAVVVLDENISQNPEAVLTTLNTREAVARAITEILVGKVSNRDVEGDTSELESDLGSAGSGRARDQPSVVGIVNRSGDLLVDGSSGSVADNDEGGAGVNDSLGGLAERDAVVGGILDKDLPVALLGDGDVGQGAGVLGRVNATKEVLSALAVEEALGGQKDRDDGLSKGTSSDGIVQEGLDSTDGFDGVETETEETILGGRTELGGLLGGETNGLADRDTSDVDEVRAEDAGGSRTIAVGNAPFATISLVGGRLGRVETGVGLASGGGAGARREPNIRGTLL